jgi:superfamily II DNA or RNA helicase
MPDAVTLSYDRGTLRLSGVSPEREPDGLARGVWQYDERVGAWRCEALHYADVSPALFKEYGDAFSDRVLSRAPVSLSETDLPELRADQRSALDAWRAAGRRGVVVMPTGTGKTEVALAAMAEHAATTLVVAPVRDLMYQWHRRILKRLGYDAGVVGDRFHNIRPVTVATYDSAYLHMAELGDRFELIVFDEVHHLPGRARREAALLCAAPMRLGLTATLERSDGLHEDLAWLVGATCYVQPVSDARGKTLAEYDVIRVPVALTGDEQERFDRAGDLIRAYMSKKRAQKRDYDWQQVCAESGHDPEARRVHRAFQYRTSIEDRAAEKMRVLEDIFRLHAGERVIVFAGSNVMAMEVSCRFLVPTLLSHSRKRERIEVLDRFASGAFPVVVANRVLDEGVDVPEAKVAVVIGGQASKRQAKQRLGRILRRHGLERAKLYEVVCEDTREVERSRSRRRSDAFGGAGRWSSKQMQREREKSRGYT